MCFYKKKFEALSKEIVELKNIIVTQELTKLRAESKDYAHVRENLSKVQLEVKSLKFINDDTVADPFIEVVYQPKSVKLFIDADSHISKNDFFIASNELNLLSLNDMSKISKFIEKSKKEAKL